MNVQERILNFVSHTNWVLFCLASMAGLILAPPEFARGIIFGGLIVTINFCLLSRTLKKAFAPPRIASHNIILAKYYIRFIVSGIIIFVLIYNHYVHPVGLVIGLSVVVASIVLATALELKKIIFKEAV